MDGQAVCRVHGGAAAQNRAAAERRLMALSHPAISVMQRALLDYPKRPAIALMAAREILERNGF
jgi:hypothetical protein